MTQETFTNTPLSAENAGVIGAVMEKAAVTAIMFALLLSAAAGISVVKLANANFVGFWGIEACDLPLICIDSPLNKTYNYNGKVLLNLTISPSENWSYYYETVNSFNYSLDGEFAKTIIVNSSLSEYPCWQNGREGLVKPFSYSTLLENLTDGNHVVRVFVKYTGYFLEGLVSRSHSEPEGHPEMVVSAMVSFTLDTISPIIEIVSVESKTYYGSDLKLNFAVNEDFCNASYVLDGENVPVAGNLTLSGLPVGNHSLTVYVYDRAGNIGASDPITFEVKPFPTALVIVSVSAVAIIFGIGLFGHFRKHNGVEGP